MDPFTGAAIAGLVPMVGSMLMGGGSRPSGPDYSQVMAYLNSPEMIGYRNQLMDTAFNPNNALFDQAMNRSMASGNRLAASRGLGTSGAGLGFIQNAQNDLASKFAENEFQRRLQAYQAATGAAQNQAQIGMNMANNQYDASMAVYNDEQAGRAGLIGGLGTMVNAGLSAYNYNQQQNALKDMMAGFASRTPGYGGTPAGSVFGAPIQGGNYNYGFPTR